MDFESVFLANEDNFKEAFVNNANISNFTFKIKNFIYYNDVETAVKLGNKHLAGVLWLSHLLERRDSHAKENSNTATYLPESTEIITLTRKTMVDPFDFQINDSTSIIQDNNNNDKKSNKHTSPATSINETTNAKTAHINPYLQKLKLLSEDTFMTNSTSNGINDQMADHQKRDNPNNHMTEISAKIKNPTAVLDALKSSSTKNNTNVSIHVTKDEDAPITYDAYVKLSDMEEYFTIENKLAYIEILAWNYRGFVGTEINKDDNEIIIKNSLYKGMLNMVRLFNHKCRQRRFLKMQLKTYFLIDGLKVSSKEFKILNVSKHFIRDDIEQAITKLIDFL
ncbi:hypothetical protein GLOIN_2v1820860 [Rhizophagus clarus]|uniref:Uncharacterized protein n=1 Tax=Rhizophagus clarus TaxID=94130 RepID=A0A8H3LHN7_9GLOM|nr:hypothetical protein GLOIN_2v1820860 [Rhizophagus clarus]